MQIRKNTKAFKTILEILTRCQTRADRDDLIRLYITKAGHSIANRINVQSIEGDSALFYEMNYDTVLSNLKASNRQLHVSEDPTGIYFFRSGPTAVWDETPFDFDEAVLKEFSSLPEMPAVRKKEKVTKYVIPQASDDVSKEKRPAHVKATKAEKKVEKPKPKESNYHLRHEFEIINPDTIVFRHNRFSKRQVLDYYNDVSQYILPLLKDRVIPNIAEDIATDEDELPDWLRRHEKTGFLCNDREHLLFYVNNDCITFKPRHAKIKTPAYPDYLVLEVDGHDVDMPKLAAVAQAVRSILDALKIPSLVKTDALASLHLYIPLDGRSDFDVTAQLADILRNLVQLKVRDLISLNDDDHTYGRVPLRSLNQEDETVIAPYALLPGKNPVIATPVTWDEVDETLAFESFTPEAVLKRLKKHGDLFTALSKKKIDAKAVVKELNDRYAFLF